MALGKVDRRHITRMFFPRLFRPGQSPAISTETRTLIYEKCLRPAAVDVNPFDQSRWPIDYSAAMTLYRDTNGRFHFGTVDFPANLLGSLGMKLRELFQMHENLKDAFFVHELRGTKGSSHHNPTNAEDQQRALDGVLDLFNRDLIKDEDWVVDVGIEVRHEGHVLQWLTTSHRHILEFILPSASEENITAVLASRQQYHRDLNAQLEDLSGFRALPASRGKADGVIYVNVYTTDKSATYQLHEGVFRRRKPWHLFPASIRTLLQDVHRIAGIFHRCGGSTKQAGLEGNARMEIRVPLNKADDVLLGLPDSLVQTAVASYECPLYW